MWRSSPLHCHGLLDIPTVGSSRAEEREREGRRKEEAGNNMYTCSYLIHVITCTACSSEAHFYLDHVHVKEHVLGNECTCMEHSKIWSEPR